MGKRGPKPTKGIKRYCKICDREFTARKRDVDAGKARFCSKDCLVEHRRIDNAIVQLTCLACGKCFSLYRSQANPARRFCSTKCASGYQKVSVVCQCQQCGQDFEVCPSKANGEKKAKFCNRKCSSQGQKHKQSPPPKQFVCMTCDQVFLEKLGRERKYCSNKCATTALRKHVGEKTNGRGKECAKWALAVVRRDKRCLKCGVTESLQAHHIEHWKNCPEKRFDLDNGATLCAHCHHSQHPNIPLKKFLSVGGVAVRRCVVCESAFVSRKNSQRACGRTCGAALNASNRKSKMEMT